MHECRLRVLRFLTNTATTRLASTSSLGHAVWPDTTFHAQGAAFAVGKILRGLQDDGFVKWKRTGRSSWEADDWGYIITDQGRVWLEKQFVA
jgi:hypothetical protein